MVFFAQCRVRFPAHFAVIPAGMPESSAMDGDSRSVAMLDRWKVSEHGFMSMPYSGFPVGMTSRTVWL
jgi:hypothetical protein